VQNNEGLAKKASLCKLPHMIRKRSRLPLPPAKKAPQPEYTPEEVVRIDLPTAKYWARFAAGEIRASLWSDVVRKMERIEARGGDAICLWWHVKVKKHSAFNHGLLEVKEVLPPIVKVRSRRPQPSIE